MNNILTNDFGKSFPPAMSFGGYVFLAAGLIAVFSFIPLGIIFILFGSFVAFTRSGVQINIDSKKFRSYNSFLGLKQGKWKSLNEWTQITLFKHKSQTAVFSLSNRRALTPEELFYEITVLNPSFSKRLAVKRLKNKETALEDLKSLSELLKLPIVKYPPKRTIKKRN